MQPMPYQNRPQGRDSAGREVVLVNVRLPRELHRHLRSVAYHENVSMQMLMQKAIVDSYATPAYKHKWALDHALRFAGVRNFDVLPSEVQAAIAAGVVPESVPPDPEDFFGVDPTEVQ